jgi:simple sugar transport system permease protein
MLEAGLVASGLTGEWVRTVQGLVFLAAVIFYLYMEEPHRRGALMRRLRLGKPAAGEAARPVPSLPAQASRANKTSQATKTSQGGQTPQRQGR